MPRLPKLIYPKFPKHLNSVKGLNTWMFKDSDRDGMPNLIDCQPFNPRMQGVKPNKLMRDRINKLNVYVTKSPYSETSRIHNRNLQYRHISAKDAPYQQKQQVYSTFKKYPNLITTVEKSKGSILFTPEILTRGKPSSAMGYQNESLAVVELQQDKNKNIEGTMETAKIVAHEAKHLRTEKYTPGKLYKKQFKGEYTNQPGEIRARQSEEKIYYSRPDINIKRIKTKLNDTNSSSYETRDIVTGQVYEYPKESVEKSITDYKQNQQQETETGFKQITQKSDTAEEQSTKPWYKKAYEKVKSYINKENNEENSEE